MVITLHKQGLLAVTLPALFNSQQRTTPAAAAAAVLSSSSCGPELFVLLLSGLKAISRGFSVSSEYPQSEQATQCAHWLTASLGVLEVCRSLSEGASESEGDVAARWLWLAGRALLDCCEATQVGPRGGGDWGGVSGEHHLPG